jgi:hypothetical protein
MRKYNKELCVSLWNLKNKSSLNDDTKIMAVYLLPVISLFIPF